MTLCTEGGDKKKKVNKKVTISFPLFYGPDCNKVQLGAETDIKIWKGWKHWNQMSLRAVGKGIKSNLTGEE